MQNQIITYYYISWIILTSIWLILLITKRKKILLFTRGYVNFILKKLKIIIFLTAFLLLTIIANLWLDPTWDNIETIIMSLLTYFTAPYSIWTIYRYIKWLNKNFYEFYISIILLFFSSAWFYDIYVYLFILWEYPLTAFSNLFLSPFFYILAWMIWSLDYSKKDWVILIFSKTEWIDFKGEKWWVLKIFLYSLPIIIFMIIIFWYFIYLNI